MDKVTTLEKVPKVTERKRVIKSRRSERQSPEPVLELKEPLGERENTGPEEPVQEASAPSHVVADQVVALVEQNRFQEIMNDLRKLDRIMNDNGQEIDFEGSTKETFLNDVEGAYPLVGAALNSLYETGKFLYEVRERQKPNHLWMKYQEITGLSTSFINNYVRIYEKYGDRLPEFAYMGVSKLEVVARLNEPIAFIEANREVLEKAAFKEVRQRVKAEKEKGVKHRSQRKAAYEDVGSFRLKLPSNGRSLTISNLNKELQKELMEVLKGHLSHRK
jgi:hypothetical protein